MTQGLGLCASCGVRPATELHHLHSQTKRAKRLYGQAIHDKKNLIPLCTDCHHNRPVRKDDEFEFCRKQGITPLSKSAKMRIAREEQFERERASKGNTK